MTVLDQIKSIVDQMEDQRRLGSNCNWSEIYELGKRLGELAERVERSAWAHMTDNDIEDAA